MSFTKSRKVHLKKHTIFGESITYKKHGSVCGTADIDTYELKNFCYYAEKYPSEICKNCLKKFNDIEKVRLLV